ncbi:cyclopropane-fatty-acyl-phospholipid synthase family protein [Aquisalimonas sp.]|uniref:SAM-dependent methyltransferase n=1 Tax=Aquisalimonas sp. TaxID=1872621 RepID=UPI0025C36F00|nr:cyclopropane-fatty-acyl-phospholipid synthase family protein [Aquisalimonas sp.]
MTNETEHSAVQRRNPLALPGNKEPSSSTSIAPERWLLRKVHEAVGEPPLRLRLWDGCTVGPESSDMMIELRDRGALYRLLRHPNLAFGDLHSSGRLRIHGELTRVIHVLIDSMNAQAHGTSPAWTGWFKRGRKLRVRKGANLTAARGNIHHHYDLGNDFYRLWLDRAAMQYTCAYFESPDYTLEQAQLAKLEHVCRKLRLQPGQTVIDAGCGWGGLARYMAKQYGVRVRAFNISHEQVAYAREAAREEGLEDRVEFIEEDFRNISGSCDRFVSVGMLEHVGPANYKALAGVVSRCLHADGLGLIHTIGRNRPAPLDAWIEKRIFPGGYVPSAGELMRLFEYTPFSVLDVENLRLHYAQTLDHWLERFRAHREEVARDYDEPFVRAWELYLAGSSATFRSGGLQLFQVVFAHPRNNQVPRVRKDLYHAPAAPSETP